MQASEGDSLTFRSTHISVLLYCERPEKSIKTSVQKRFGGLVMDSNTLTIKRSDRGDSGWSRAGDGERRMSM